MAFQNKDDWQNDFAEFSSLEPVASESLPKGFREGLKARLFPSPWLVFAKVAALHAISGTASLAICHQFELNPFSTRHSLADLYMNAGGHHFCLFACGLTFVAGTYLLACFFLSLEELENLRRHHWLQTAALSLASLVAFWLFGAELATALVLLWLTGALLGGTVSLEGLYRLRRRWVLG